MPQKSTKAKLPRKNPSQPIILDGDGTPRFKKNKIVRYLLDAGGLDLNQLHLIDFDTDDWVQFYQLIGTSVSGYGDLGLPRTAVIAADRAAAKLKGQPRARRGS